jgi:hypothetical protein
MACSPCLPFRDLEAFGYTHLCIMHTSLDGLEVISLATGRNSGEKR